MSFGLWSMALIEDLKFSVAPMKDWTETKNLSIAYM